MIASDDKGFLPSVDPAFLDIPANGSADVIVQLLPPAGTPQGTSDTLTVTVESTDPLGPRNFAVVTSIVGTSNTVPVANAGLAQTLECSSPQGAPVRLDGSASTDADNEYAHVSLDRCERSRGRHGGDRRRDRAAWRRDLHVDRR